MKEDEELLVAVIKCPAGLWRGLPRPRAMLMSLPAGQHCLISAWPTIWREGRRAAGRTLSQVTNGAPQGGGQSVNWGALRSGLTDEEKC